MSTLVAMDFRHFAEHVGSLKIYEPGEIIFHEGDAPDSMYVVLEGSVELIAHGKIVEVITAGNALGILSLLDNQTRTTTATACETTRVAVVDRRKFRYMLDEMPHFCRYVIGELAHRLRTTNAAL